MPVAMYCPLSASFIKEAPQSRVPQAFTRAAHIPQFLARQHCIVSRLGCSSVEENETGVFSQERLNAVMVPRNGYCSQALTTDPELRHQPQCSHQELLQRMVAPHVSYPGLSRPSFDALVTGRYYN